MGLISRVSSRTYRFVITWVTFNTKMSEQIRVHRLDNVQWLENRAKPRSGTLHLTKSHMLFIDAKTQTEEWILHSHIASIETPQNSTTNPDSMNSSQSSNASSAISNFNF